MVLPVDVSTSWFSKAVINASEVIFSINDGKNTGRVGFIDSDTGLPVKGNNRGTMIAVFEGKKKPTRTLYHTLKFMRQEAEKWLESESSVSVKSGNKQKK